MDDWLFADPPDTGVFTTQRVLDGAPVRDVFHDQDGDWQVHRGWRRRPVTLRARVRALLHRR